jgi:flagellar M-ring protein FliF
MRDQITGRLQWLQRSFGSFTAGQKVVAVIGGLALVLGAVMVFRWASAPSYAPLFTNMAPADASAVVDKLNSAGTPYQLADSGTTVLVPQNDVYDARIKLSGEGLPSQSSEGYGLLDKQGLSTSQFQEQTTFKRATEGELEKTISALDPVNAAIVHIAMPQEQLFSTDQQPTTASVLVQTQPGSTLTTEQVQAIVHLVASSVTGLDPKNVTVTDSAGNVLNTAGDDQYAQADTRTQQVQAFEDRMSANVTSMLDRIVGPGNSTTQVTADLNFDKAAFRTTRYFTKPKPLPLSLSKSSEKYAGAAGTAGGVVGPDGQLDPTATTGTPGTPGSKYGKNQETPSATRSSSGRSHPEGCRRSTPPWSSTPSPSRGRRPTRCSRRSRPPWGSTPSAGTPSMCRRCRSTGPSSRRPRPRSPRSRLPTRRPR